MGIALALTVSLLAGCGGDKTSDDGATGSPTATNTTVEATQKPLMEITVFPFNTDANKIVAVENPNDVVTPYIEKKFGIKIKDVFSRADNQTIKELINLWSAAGNMPDVLGMSKEDASYAISTDNFFDLTDLTKNNMPNYNKYMPEDVWKMYETDGKRYQVPASQTMYNYADPSDPYTIGETAWTMWMREDILSQLGYKFTPMDEIQKNICDKGKKPTAEDYKIEPAISTPDDFYNLLKKVQALNIKIGDKPLIPLTMDFWEQWHFGNMFGVGHWTKDENGVNGLLGSTYAKEYYQFMNKLYIEDLLDKDFLIQKSEVHQEKVASGRVFAGMFVPDYNAAKSAMAQVNPNYKIRPVVWPKKIENYGSFDISSTGGGFWRYMISKNCKEPERLIEFWDWLYSDEGMDITAWGPEEGGLWVMKEGKKVFVDAAVEADFKDFSSGEKGADYWGVYDDSKTIKYSSRIVAAAPAPEPNLKSWNRSYPAKLNAFDVAGILGMNGRLKEGKYFAGDDGANTSANTTWYWDEFTKNKCALLFTANSEDKFNSAWDQIMNEYTTKGKYNEAKADMEKYFEKYGTK